MGTDRILEPDEFDDLCCMAEDANLYQSSRRAVFLRGLPNSFSNRLDTMQNPADQLRSDLWELNKRPSLRGFDETPLVVWLREAVHATRDFDECECFERVLDLVEARFERCQKVSLNQSWLGWKGAASMVLVVAFGVVGLTYYVMGLQPGSPEPPLEQSPQKVVTISALNKASSSHPKTQKSYKPPPSKIANNDGILPINETLAALKRGKRLTPPKVRTRLIKPHKIIPKIDLPKRVRMKGVVYWPNNGNKAHRMPIKEFWMARAETTVAQYKDCVDQKVCQPRPQTPGCTTRLSQPVNCVTRENARTYARFVNGRLPTEVQWAWAAQQASHDGSLGKLVSCTRPKCPTAPHNVCAIGQDDGLCDVYGNLAEWVEDDFTGDRPPSPSGKPSKAYSKRPMHKGGAWDTQLSKRTPFDRVADTRPAHKLTRVGFRVAWSRDRPH